MNRYTHQYAVGEVDALSALPDLSSIPTSKVLKWGPDETTGTEMPDLGPRPKSRQQEGDPKRPDTSRRDLKGFGMSLLAGITEPVKPLAETKKRDVMRDDAKESETVGVGFEPTVTRRPRRFSRPVHSTALAPHREVNFALKILGITLVFSGHRVLVNHQSYRV